VQDKATPESEIQHFGKDGSCHKWVCPDTPPSNEYTSPWSLHTQEKLQTRQISFDEGIKSV